LLAPDALKLGIVDGIISEPTGGAHRDADEAAKRVGEQLRKSLFELQQLEGERGAQSLIDQRYAKFRAMGEVVQQ
jgi:acetyl-CoA carboxylase carboxyl transferase subunit alpha